MLTCPVTNFIQQKLPDGSVTGASTDQPGALGMGQRASTGITTFNQFWQYCMPLLGAYVADAHWGRYKTISTALGVNLIGHVILILSAIPPVIVNPSGSVACLIIAILIIGFGTGGFKPNISCLIVEQLGDQRLFVKTLPKTGERVIVDPAVTTEKIYMWFYFFINVGALVGQVSMVYAEQYVGFYLSYTLPTVMLALCPLVMLWGRKRYVRRAPDGSVLVPALRVFFLAQRGRWSINPWATWRNMHDGTFWEKVKPSNISVENRPKWMTFDDAWVDELRRGFNACAVFCWYPIFWLCYNQSKFMTSLRSILGHATLLSCMDLLTTQSTTTSSPRLPSSSATASPTTSSPTSTRLPSSSSFPSTTSSSTPPSARQASASPPSVRSRPASSSAPPP